ncbi:MAG TPA: hypothetical protein K8U78_02630 [Aeriscardovia aeriphila]|uniref:Uncharacterized protein n=1 Tax=Aeriscardovia aeriphila TaxID=218139 RepID=A0A921FUS6_9BIFI|nr:hypothetical protein [Aeriscardovia aeriphila]
MAVVWRAEWPWFGALSGRGLARWVAGGRGLTLTGVASATATAYYM